MPVWRSLLARWPNARLEASGEAVGLPPGQMGNSEVGHLNIGAGRPVLQDLPRIDAAIDDGSFFARPALIEACRRARETRDRLNVVGLVGPGGVHAHDRQIVALAELARREGVGSFRLHALLDGRDTPPRSALEFVPALEARAGRRPPGCPDRVRGRAVLRDGPRPALGPDGAGLRRDRPRGGGARAQRDRRDRRGVRPGHRRRVRAADDHRSRRRPDRRPAHRPRARRPRELPSRSGPPARPRARGPGVRRLRPGCSGRPARAGRPARGHDDRVRGGPARPGRVPAGGRALPRGRDRGGGLAPAPRRRDGEVRARHVLPQRRPGGAVPERGPDPGPEPEGRDLRTPARDERAGGDGRARGAGSSQATTTS